MMNRPKMMKDFPPLIKGKAASTNAGIGKPLKKEVKTIINPVDNSLRASPSAKMRAGRK
jgi:hypothetical protein